MSESEMTWSTWLAENGFSDLLQISPALGARPWKPSERDRNAAWILYTEIRTRIASQPLHYRSGDEETALDSLYKLFEPTRQVIKNNGPECWHFAEMATYVLNTHLRPLTAKWHKKKIEGRLLNDDERREFRGELQALQRRLLLFCKLLGKMAAGAEDRVEFGCQTWATTNPAADTDILGPAINFERILFDDRVAQRQDLYDAELKAIRARRSDLGPVPNLVGLACSGGGIRSATFCLGVAQSLARHGILSAVDYLSTVSGGGYFGSFLSSYLNDQDQTKVGLAAGKLPFTEANQAEPTPIRQLRNNSKYLLKGGLLGQARMAALLLLGILVNLLTLLPVLFVGLALTMVAELGGVTQQCFHDGVGWLLLGLIGLLVLVLLGLPVVYLKWASERKKIATYEKWAIRIALFALGVWFLGWALPWLYQSLLCLTGSPGAVLGLIATLPVLFAGIAFVLGTATAVGRALIVLAGVAGPLLLLMTYFALHDWIDTSFVWVITFSLIAVALIGWLWFINANQISPHRYYRNRLAETYLLRRGEKTAVDPQPLSSLRANNPTAPYHLINAAVNLPGSKEPELRGRDSDFFLFSRHFCGSPLLGYCRTEDLEQKDPNLDLGTAMAISGAAASTYMGTGTTKGLVFWLALLNIRLAYWAPNPKRLAEVPDGFGPRPFSLWKELFGGIDENGRYVNLSDGGHIENLGIYELLRRRCKFIIAIDGEADPGMTFPSLMQLVRYAQIDFGINIRMALGDLTRNESGHSKAHFVLGEIVYGEQETGYLLYIKSSLTGNERDYVLAYHRSHPTFPHESTADQFFSEAQFEAYRTLGEHIGEDLFQPELISESAEKPSDLTLESWFGALVCNLLPVRIL